MRKIVIGSRRSNLALTQTEWVIEKLKGLNLPYTFEVKKIMTKGDKILDVTLSKVGGKGLFVKEIEQAMYDKEVDLAVHSMKDMPSEMPDGLVIASIPEREDHRDAFISKDSQTKLKDLPEGAIVGTSSLRRAAQVLVQRPDVKIKSIRGNIETRMRKLKEEDYDAIVLAAAGLKRMDWPESMVTEFLEPDVCVPAVGQGALAIECREEDTELRELLEKINDEYTARTVTAERTFLHLLEGGCQVPIAGYAYLDGEEIVLTALIAKSDGSTVLHEVVRGTDPVEVGKEAADRMFKKGGKEMIDEAKEELDQS
ncbi:hydroxymethylbilane synthase [Salinibacillus xinjiangensis]|uniref:Porphobilinogen deaminase n=1 Tax=Salinibacillus xinjiangensis TaxID=1229268 RepID=A0A6G1XB89_9BACI|nr:hydroxymethylbilane synthase [Salinibacillus xinjiangensis]MRG88207.1 hydroxymethylbilane synthase [Salinibacillus xinjiangensis]